MVSPEFIVKSGKCLVREVKRTIFSFTKTLGDPRQSAYGRVAVCSLRGRFASWCTQWCNDEGCCNGLVLSS